MGQAPRTRRGFLPNGVCLTGYSGDATDLPQAVLHGFLDAVAAGEATVPIARTYTMDEIATAHDDTEHDPVTGKLVVSTQRASTLAWSTNARYRAAPLLLRMEAVAQRRPKSFGT